MINAMTTPQAPAPWFDPGWLIHRTLALVPDTTANAVPADTPPEPLEATAEDAIVAWLLRLPDDRDPALAARELLDAYSPALAAGDPMADRLNVRLAQVAAYPRERLARVHAGGRRRRRPRRTS